MLTPEQKKTVAEWMGWKNERGSKTTFCKPTFEEGVGIAIHFSLNDASLCVDELVKQEKWHDFHHSAYEKSCPPEVHKKWEFVPWLFTTNSGEATNFFKAYYQWIEKEKEK